MLKRLISFLLSLAMVVSMVPAQAFATETEPLETTAEVAVETVAETEVPETAPAETLGDSAPETTEPRAQETEPPVMAPVETTPPETMPETTGPEETVAETEPVTEAAAAAIGSGTCGDNLTWELSDDGTLTISGTGAMKDYSTYNSTRAPWAKYASSITRLVIENGVTYVGKYAFYNCTSLTSVSMADSVTTAGIRAFWDCTALTDVRLSEGLTSIAEGMFYSCSSLAFIKIPASVATISSWAFYRCTGLREVEISEGVTLIEEYAFSYAGLKEVGIPRSVETIGQGAFSSCEDLETLIIEDGVSQIGKSAFTNCVNLKKVRMPTSVTELAYHIYTGGGAGESSSGVFLGCDSITSAGPMGSGCDYEYGWTTEIPAGAFAFLPNLSKIIIPETVTKISYTKTGTKITSAGPIGSGCDLEFGWKTQIIDGAFMGLSGLTSISLPETVTTIGRNAFNGCSSLTELNLPEGVTSVGDAAFAFCSSLTEFEIPKGITVLPRDTFASCAGLNSILIPENITEIGYMAFAHCTGLQSVVVPESVVQLGSGVFEGCTGLINADIRSPVTVIPTFFFEDCTALKTVTLPETLKTIKQYAFNKCTALAEIHFLGSYGRWQSVSVEKYNDPVAAAEKHFYELTGGTCGENTSWTLTAKGLLTVFGQGQVTEAPWRSYNSRIPITQVVIESGVTSLPGGAFARLDSLEKVTIAETVIEFERADGPFGWCPKLTSVGPMGSGCDLEYGWTSRIPNDAFYHMENLTKVVWPESSNGGGITAIGERAFFYCTALEEITIPDTVESIGTQAFAYCESLKSLTLPPKVTKIISIVSDCTSLEEMVILGGVDVINSGDFRGCTSLKAITLPRSLYYVASQSFRDCTALTDVYYMGSQQEWDRIRIEAGNEPLLQATLHAGWNAVYLGDVRYYDSWNEGRGMVYFVGDDYECLVTEETDLAFTADPEALLDTYVLVQTRWEGDQEILLSMKPLETKSGTVSYCDPYWTIIGEETYATPVDLAYPQSYTGQYVLYHVYEGNIAGIEALLFPDYLDNDAIEINGAGSAYAYYLGSPFQVIHYRDNSGTEKQTQANKDGVFCLSLGTFRTQTVHTAQAEIFQIGNVTLDPAIVLDATVTVKKTAFTQTWEGSFDVGLGVALTAGGKLELLGNSATATLGKVGASGNLAQTMSISHGISESGETLELITNVKGTAGADVQSGITAKTLKGEFEAVNTSANVKSSENVMYGIKFPDYSMEDGGQQAAIATYFLGEALRMFPNSVWYWGFYNALREYVYEESGAVVIDGSGAGISGNIGAAFGAVEVDDITVFEAIGTGAEASSSYSKKNFSNGETEKSAAFLLEENIALYSLGAGNKEASYNAGGLLSMDFLGKDITVTAQKTDDGNVLDATFLSAAAVGFNTFILEKNYTSQYGHYIFREDPLNYLYYNTAAVKAFVEGDRKVLSAEDIGEIGQFLSASHFHIPYSRMIKEQAVYSLPLTFGLGLAVEADIGVTLSYMESTNYDAAMGYAAVDQIMLTSESENAAAAVAREKMSLPDLMLGSMASLAEAAGEFFVSVGNNIVDGVESAWAWITGKPDSKHDRTVSITSARGGGGGGGGHRAWATSYSVDTRSETGARTTLAGGIAGAEAGAAAMSRAATIGRPFVISVTDNATNERVTDFSDEPLEFTIRYAPEDLEAAGLSAQSGAVLDGGIAMYRYSDEGDYFEHIGGVNDLEAMTVTAEITRPGQYVLAADSCAPSIAALDLSDFHSMPTITARIDDLSGLDVSKFLFTLDGQVKVDGSNVSQYFSTETGSFAYTVPESEALAEGEHTMSFTLADTTGNSETYEYTFNVDLTAPTVENVTVRGYTNEDSLLKIRAQAGDANLTNVYALLSKQLPDGTWTAEAGVEMGDMGAGTWGVDYQGDGSALKVRICAVDVAGNQTYSDIFEAKAYVEHVELSQDYLALRVGQTMELTAKVKPAGLAGSLTWTVEEGTAVVSVKNGIVTAKAPGTAWVVATATDGETEISARCRIDVAQSITLEGVKLGTSKVTTELYSTDYAELDILLLLPQNYSVRAVGEETSEEKLSAAVGEAYFADEALQQLFQLRLLDDRTVEIIPTPTAIYGEKLAKSYTGTIKVVVEGKTYETEPLTLTVKTSLPKLKVTVPAFNSFYSGQSQKVEVTGAAVTGISAYDLPEWLELNGGELTLTAAAPKKSASAKVGLEIMTEEWAVPVSVTVTVKNTYKAPGLKLSASSIQLSDQPGSSQGVGLQLLPKNKKETLSDLKVRYITAPEGYSITDWENGTFVLKAGTGFVPGKIHLEVSFSNTTETVKLPVTVKAVQTKLKLSKTGISLNGEIGDSAIIGITATPGDYVLTAPSFRLTDAAGSDRLGSGELEVRYEDGAVSVSTTEKTAVGASYTLYVKAGGSKEAAVKIKIVGGVPTVSLKQSSDLDLSFGSPAIVTASFKNYAGGRIGRFTYTVTETKSGTDATEFFTVEENSGQFHLICTEPGEVSEKGAYVLNLKLTLAEGRECQASLKLKVKRTAIKLKLSASKLTLNKAVNDVSSVSVTCTTKGYDFTKPVWHLLDKSGKQPMEGKLTIDWIDGKLQIATNDQTEYGASYKLFVSTENGAATALTISIPAEAKSAVTATLKVKGSLDVIRSGSVTVTPSYKNCAAETPKTEELLVVRSDNQVVTDQFDIVRNADGTYTLSIAEGAQIDLTKKYQVQMVTTFAAMEVKAKAAPLNIKMGSAKLTVETEGTLFSQDRHSRMNLTFSSADAALNQVARIELKDAKQAEIFEIFDYGNGQFAIGFKDGKTLTSAKPITVTLNVYLAGNTGTKPNAAVKLKLSITP